MKHFKSWGTSFAVWSNNLKYCRSRHWLPTEFVVNHLHLYCLSLGKELSPEETSYALVCVNKPTHQAYFTRPKSTPKLRWGDHTVDYPTWRLEKATFRHCGKPGCLQPSPIWFVFHDLHSHRKCFWVRVTVFPQVTYKVPSMNLDKVHPSMKGTLENDRQRSGGSQAAGAHYRHKQTPWNSIRSWGFPSAPGLAAASTHDKTEDMTPFCFCASSVLLSCFK